MDCLVKLGPFKEIGIDTEGTPKDVWGMSLSVEPGEAEVARCKDHDGLLPFTPIAGCQYIFHNYMWDAQVLAAKGIEIDEDSFHDTMLMAYLLGVEPQALKDLAERHLGRIRKTYEETVGKWVTEYTKAGKPKKKQKLVLQTLDDIPRQQATDYAGGDADDTLSLKPILWAKVQALDLGQIYEIDRKALPLYARMETVGLPIDLPHYQTFGKWLGEDLALRTAELQHEYPDLNPGSASQVSALLFKHLHLPVTKKTPGGVASTNDKILQALKGHHPIVEKIIDWREVQKFKTAFVDKIASYTGPGPLGDLRLFFRLLPTRVVSGRLAAKDPNVLAFPKHSPLGKRFRAGVRAPEGRLLGSWDLNQIELRVLALDSGSTTLIELFNAKGDVHARTAEKIFGVPKADQDDSLHRLPAKAVNFGIPMGMTEVGLAEQMRKNGYPFPELIGVGSTSPKQRREQEAEVCKSWIEAVIDDWGLEPFIADAHAEARRYGYVSDRWKRKRFLPSILSPNPRIREEAKRQAQAFRPQAGARGFYKTIVVRVWREVIKPLRQSGEYIEPLLDLHDDLMLEFDASLIWIKPIVEDIFNTTFSEKVPITCKGKVGQAWSDL